MDEKQHTTSPVNYNLLVLMSILIATGLIANIFLASTQLITLFSYKSHEVVKEAKTTRHMDNNATNHSKSPSQTPNITKTTPIIQTTPPTPMHTTKPSVTTTTARPVVTASNTTTKPPPIDRSAEIQHLLSRMKLNPATGAYEFEGRPIIWQYWDNDNIPLYVRLLSEAIQCRNPELKVVFVGDSTVYQLLPDLEFNVPEKVFRLFIAQHKADTFRVAVLLAYGGMYIDTDTFALDKIYPLYQMLTTYDIVSAAWGDVKIALGAIGPTRANLTIFRVWHQNQAKKVRDAFERGYWKRPSHDPFGWADILLAAMKGIDQEVEAGRTKYLGYNGGDTVGQAVMHGLMNSPNANWSVASRIAPPRWAPYLMLHGSEIKKFYFNAVNIKELMPENTTFFSAFVGCAMLDCYEQFKDMKKQNIPKTPLGQLDVADLLEVLGKLNRTICESIRKEPIFELGKYINRPKTTSTGPVTSTRPITTTPQPTPTTSTTTVPRTSTSRQVTTTARTAPAG